MTVLFDGICNLCNGAVRAIIANDPGATFRFAALTSDAGRALLAEHAIDPAAIDSIVLIDGTRAYVRSDAALRIAGELRAPWPLLVLLLALPQAMRDRAYDAVARNRYRIFGTRADCALPTPEMRARFL